MSVAAPATSQPSTIRRVWVKVAVAGSAASSVTAQAAIGQTSFSPTEAKRTISRVFGGSCQTGTGRRTLCPRRSPVNRLVPERGADQQARRTASPG